MSFVVIIILFSFSVFLIPWIGAFCGWVMGSFNGNFTDYKRRSRLKNNIYGIIVYFLLLILIGLIFEIENKFYFLLLFFPFLLFIFPITGAFLRWLIINRKKKLSEVYGVGHVIDLYIGFAFYVLVYLVLDYVFLFPSYFSLLR